MGWAAKYRGAKSGQTSTGRKRLLTFPFLPIGNDISFLCHCETRQLPSFGRSNRRDALSASPLEPEPELEL